MNRLFILREPVHLENLIAFLRLNWKAMAQNGAPMAARLAPYKRDRSGEQNALMWVWLGQVEEQAWVAGVQFSADTWNEHFKRALLPDTCAKGVEKWRFLPSGERVLNMSTTHLNVAEMGDYMTALCAMASGDFGVLLS